jgi:osmotically-inducible protein OsmY
MNKTNPDKKEQTHTLILIGKSESVEVVETTLRVLDVEIIKKREAMQALNSVDERVSGIVFVDPLPKAPTYRACRVFRNSVQAQGIPLFVIFTDEQDDRNQARARRLYRVGATAVFEWPKEREQIPRLMMDMLHVEIKSKPSDTDIALARAIRLRLKAANIDWGKQIREVVTNGIVSVSGFVDSLWKKRELARIVADTPGVNDVGTWNLTVKTQGINDEDIVEATRNTLENIDGIDLSTLALSVTDGRVRLVGTVRNHNESMRLIDIISQIRGVQDVENLTRVSAHEKENDSVIARKVTRKINSLYPDSDLRVSLIGGVMVLSGTAENLPQKQQIQILALASAQNSVTRTINKISIASRKNQKERR